MVNYALYVSEKSVQIYIYIYDDVELFQISRIQYRNDQYVSRGNVPLFFQSSRFQGFSDFPNSVIVDTCSIVCTISSNVIAFRLQYHRQHSLYRGRDTTYYLMHFSFASLTSLISNKVKLQLVLSR